MAIVLLTSYTTWKSMGHSTLGLEVTYLKFNILGALKVQGSGVGGGGLVVLNPLLSRGNLRIMKTHFFLQVFVCTKKHWGNTIWAGWAGLGSTYKSGRNSRRHS